jgi:DNA invertase Pin-like site-specific DNA recombinase
MSSDIPKAPRYVSYLRVSTTKQGVDGLGIEAQRETIRSYLAGVNHGAQLIEEFVEAKSGRNSDRLELEKAISRCNLAGARLIIAKLDRLSRDVHFLTGLMKAGIDFIACDMPTANEFNVHIMVSVAQYEAKRISETTKAALAVKKKELELKRLRLGDNSIRLGNPNGAKAFHKAAKGNIAAVAVIKAKATQNAIKLQGELTEIIASGINTYSGIAAKLNQRSILTPNKKSWHPITVKRLLQRLNLKTSSIMM